MALRQLQSICHVHISSLQCFLTGCTGPQDKTVLVLVPISIFHGDLCFSNSSQAIDRLSLSKHCGPVPREALMEVFEQRFAPCEETITPIWHHPHPFW